MAWRFLLEENVVPAVNLAVEEAIMRARREDLCPDTLRLWRNDRSVIVGCHSDVKAEVDLDACRRMKVEVLRRTSGGSAVYHDLGNINYSFVVRERALGARCEVLDVYRHFSEPILQGLRLLGVETEFRSPNALFLNEKKISGMAQHRFYDVILFHGTLLVDSDLAMLSTLLLNPKHEVTNISLELRESLPVEKVANAIRAGVREFFHTKVEDGELAPSEKILAEELLERKYCSCRWNIDDDQEPFCRLGSDRAVSSAAV